jgi:fatty-acyl-CoA synthase
VQGIHWWVRKWAELRGASPAVTCDGETVSWRELDRRVDVLARHFDSLGVRAGDRVGCLMPNCVEFIVALHAASRAGAIFVPLNIRYTATELGFAARHAGLAALAVDESFAELVAAAGLPVPAERVLWRGRLPDEGPRWNRASPAGGDDDGFLLFTSGSTGTPRAVLHSQAAFLWTSMDPVLVHHYSHSDVMISPMPLCFTGGLNVATALAHCGGELVLMSGFDPGTAFDLIESRRATLFHGVPVMCQRLLDHPRWSTADLSTLRLARTGAAPVSSGLMQGWLERGIPLTQGYGLTESAGAGFTLAPEDAHRFGKCGRPSFYAEVRLIAPDTGETMPAGHPGEIVMRGPQIMRGYWKEPQATARALRDGWLWTGDLAIADEDGFYEIVGRSKELIITGGLNVYPAEVEHVLRTAPGIDDVAVVGVPSARWGEEVVAVVVAGPGGIDRDQVLAHARTQLADYKCPKSFVVRREPLARTASGKVVKADVQRLALDAAGAEAAAAGAPATGAAAAGAPATGAAGRNG